MEAGVALSESAVGDLGECELMGSLGLTHPVDRGHGGRETLGDCPPDDKVQHEEGDEFACEACGVSFLWLL